MGTSDLAMSMGTEENGEPRKDSFVQPKGQPRTFTRPVHLLELLQHRPDDLSKICCLGVGDWKSKINLPHSWFLLRPAMEWPTSVEVV